MAVSNGVLHQYITAPGLASIQNKYGNTFTYTQTPVSTVQKYLRLDPHNAVKLKAILETNEKLSVAIVQIIDDITTLVSNGTLGAAESNSLTKELNDLNANIDSTGMDAVLLEIANHLKYDMKL